jgi:hypothetical protein
MTKKILIGAIVVLLALGVNGMVFAATYGTQTQDVSCNISAINEFAITGVATITLTVNAATAGQQPTAATNNTYDWAITTNAAIGNAIRITGEIGSDMPSNTTLSVTFADPVHGTGGTPVSMSTTPAAVVTGLYQTAENALDITYSFSALVNATIATGINRTITFTLTD